jgi:hypothetical protein
VYQLGEPIQIFLSSSQTTSGQLTLARPDGMTPLLFSQIMLAGATYTINGVLGLPNGARTLTLTAGSATATCTCSLGTPTPQPPGQEAERVLGSLSFQGDQDPITGPTTAGVGQAFQLTITTFGDGCVEKGDEGVILSETGASVFVYDFTTEARRYGGTRSRRGNRSLLER